MANEFVQVRTDIELPNGKRIHPALNFSAVSMPDGAARQDIADEAQSGIGSSTLPGVVPNTVTFLSCSVQVMRPVGPSVDYPQGRLEAVTTSAISTGDATPGLSSAEAEAPQLAYVWSMYSDTPGPQGRGRYYGPPLGTTALDADGRISSGIADDINTRMAALVDAIIAGTLDAGNLIVVSRKHEALRFVTSTTCHDVIRTQRRRALRV